MNKPKFAVTILLVFCLLLSSWLAVAYSIEHIGHDHDDEHCEVCITIENYLVSMKKLYSPEDIILIMIVTTFVILNIKYIWDFHNEISTLVYLKVKLSN